MRQIIIDTETTGLSYSQGHRIIELGCVEMVNRRLTHKHFHHYLNPEREVDAGAFSVHGLSNDFLEDKPIFSDIAKEFYEFIKGAELIAHNASFDIGFINHEFKLWNKKMGAVETFCSVVDTLKIARTKHPGQKNTLDALCKRYEVTHFNREYHGALLDAEILAQVYLVMTGGQATLFSESSVSSVHNTSEGKSKPISRKQGALNVIYPNEQEQKAHDKFLQLIRKKTDTECVWLAEEKKS